MRTTSSNGMHVDGVVVRRAAELALLRRGGVAERHAEAAADAEVRANRADHPAVAVGLFDDAAGNGAGRLADRARKRAEAAIGIDDRYRLGRLLARRRPSSWSTSCGDYSKEAVGGEEGRTGRARGSQPGEATT